MHPRASRLAVAAIVAAGAVATFAPPAHAVVSTVVINEIESNPSPDWVELHNYGSSPVDVSGWVFKDNDNSHAYAIPASTTIPAGGFLVLEENAQFSFGLGAADSARLFLAGGTTLVDSHTWTAHAPGTLGRCPDGTGPFVETTATRNALNNCPQTEVPASTPLTLPLGAAGLAGVAVVVASIARRRRSAA